MSTPTVQVSDKVVCVTLSRDQAPAATFDPSNYRNEGDAPVAGRVYVIEAVLPSGGVRLVGRTSFCVRTGIEVGWGTICFRLLSEVQAENRAKRNANWHADHADWGKAAYDPSKPYVDEQEGGES